jgi:hypothetical protein
MTRTVDRTAYRVDPLEARLHRARNAVAITASFPIANPFENATAMQWGGTY